MAATPSALVPLDEYVTISPGVAFGEDATIRLPQLTTGTYGTPAVDISAWTIGVDASFSESGPPDASLSAISVAKTGTREVTVTLPASVTRPMTIAKPIYLEVWRLDEGSGNRRPMRRICVPIYDPERDA